MVGILIRMKLAVLRRSMSGPRAASLIIGSITGLAAAAGTILLGFVSFPSQSAEVGFFAIAFLVWTAGFVVGPMLTGGDATLRWEYFSLLPVRPRRLAVGLLGATFVGVTPVVALIAFGLMMVYGVRMGVASALVAVPAIVLQLLFVILLSKVALQALGGVIRQRLGWELSALVVGLVIAFLNTGWFAIGPIVRLLTGGSAGAMATTVRALPSGWAIVGVDAAARSDWLLAAETLGGLLALCALLLAVWSGQLGRQLVRGSASVRSAGRGAAAHARRAVRSTALIHAAVGTPIAAVVGKELTMWVRDPRRSRFLRIALWIGIFTGVLPVLSGSLLMLPWIGVVAVVFAGALSANLYGLDAGALWLTLVSPGVDRIERIDVRGRQWAWLLFAAPAAVVLTAATSFAGVPGRMWPWVLAVLPAVLGGAAGLMPVVSLLGPAPFPDRPGGDPLDGFSDESGDQVRLQTLIVLALELLMAAPAAAVVLGGTLGHSAVLRWAGLPVGVITGCLFAWLLGRFAVRRLQAHGPEILETMRKGPQRDPVRFESDDAAAAVVSGDLPSGVMAVVGLLVTLAILLILPQGVVALVLSIVHAPVRGWFVALHFGSWLRIVVSVASILLGLGAMASGVGLAWATKRKVRR